MRSVVQLLDGVRQAVKGGILVIVAASKIAFTVIRLVSNVTSLCVASHGRVGPWAMA